MPIPEGFEVGHRVAWHHIHATPHGPGSIIKKETLPFVELVEDDQVYRVPSSAGNSAVFGKIKGFDEDAGTVLVEFDKPVLFEGQDITRNDSGIITDVKYWEEPRTEYYLTPDEIVRVI